LRKSIFFKKKVARAGGRTRDLFYFVYFLIASLYLSHSGSPRLNILFNSGNATNLCGHRGADGMRTQVPGVRVQVAVPIPSCEKKPFAFCMVSYYFYYSHLLFVNKYIFFVFYILLLFLLLLFYSCILGAGPVTRLYMECNFWTGE
jgi:hypothetical protein